MNRIASYFEDYQPSQRVRQAAWRVEVEFASAVRRASTGAPFDADELVALGIRTGRTLFQIYAAVRAAELAYAAWMNSVPPTSEL
jgi:hypothetical protein